MVVYVVPSFLFCNCQYKLRLVRLGPYGKFLQRHRDGAAFRAELLQDPGNRGELSGKDFGHKFLDLRHSLRNPERGSLRDGTGRTCRPCSTRRCPSRRRSLPGTGTRLYPSFPGIRKSVKRPVIYQLKNIFQVIIMMTLGSFQVIIIVTL